MYCWIFTPPIQFWFCDESRNGKGLVTGYKAPHRNAGLFCRVTVMSGAQGTCKDAELFFLTHADRWVLGMCLSEAEGTRGRGREALQKKTWEHPDLGKPGLICVSCPYQDGNATGLLVPVLFPGPFCMWLKYYKIPCFMRFGAKEMKIS